MRALNSRDVVKRLEFSLPFIYVFSYLNLGMCAQYWKNHADAWPVDWIEIGDVNYTKEEAIDILEGADAKDATQMLAAQLIAAKLNSLSGAHPNFFYLNETLNVDKVIDDADEFLTEYSFGSNPQDENRQNALHCKDLLDAYSNHEGN